MSAPSAFGRRPALRPTLPRGEVLGTYESYLEAQQVVNRLAEADFDVNSVSIVGNDLKSVEVVTGKLTWGRAAGAGAASGAWFGLFFGILLTFVTPNAGLFGPLFLAALLIGAAFGMLFGLASYALTRRARDFTSSSQVLASNYQVIVSNGTLIRAQELLGQGSAVPSTVTAPPPVASDNGPQVPPVA